MTTKQRLENVINNGVGWTDVLSVAEKLGHDTIEEAIRFLHRLPNKQLKEAVSYLEYRSEYENLQGKARATRSPFPQGWL